MDTQQYKRQLVAEERRLLKSLDEATATTTREQGEELVRDWSDESVGDEEKSVQFTEGNTERAMLKQVQDALKRIEDGTFGNCLVDGGPIEEKRLKAIPWTPYCLKHERQLEKADPPRTPTL